MTTERRDPMPLTDCPREQSRVIAGVAAALARRWNVDPLLVRIAFCLIALCGGIGAVLYAVLWLWLPDATKDGQRVIQQVAPAMAAWPGSRVAGLAVGLCIVGYVTMERVTPFGLGPLVILGVMAWWARRHGARAVRRRERMVRDTADPQASAVRLDPSTEFGRAMIAWQQRLHQINGAPGQPGMPHAAFERGAVPPLGPGAQGPRPQAPGPSSPYPAPVGARPGTDAPPPSPAGPQPAPAQYRAAPMWTGGPGAPAERSDPRPATAVARKRPRRVRAPWWFTLLALVLAGTAAAISSTVSTTMLGPVVAALAVITLALLVGTFIGRPRLLVVVGLVLTVLMAPASSLPPSVPSSPAVSLVWTDASQIRDVDAAAQLTEIDLTGLQLGRDQRMVVRANGSAVRIHLPDRVRVVVDYRTKASVLAFNSDSSQSESLAGGNEGTWQPSNNTTLPADAAVLTIELDLDYAMGDIQ